MVFMRADALRRSHLVLRWRGGLETPHLEWFGLDGIGEKPGKEDGEIGVRSPERSLRTLPSSSHLAPTMTAAWWAVLKHVPGFWLIPAILFDDDREPPCLEEPLIIGSGLR